MAKHNEPLYSFAALQNRLVIAGTLTAMTGLRIGAGRSNAVSGSDLPVLRDAVGRPFIPGASLKGALRARAEALVQAVGGQVRDFKALEDDLQNTFRTIITDTTLEDRDKAEKIWNKSTLIERTFGAPWAASRLFLRDAPVEKANWFGRHEVRSGVALNRDTETAEDSLLYNYEVTPAGTQFAFRLTLENAEDWQLGLVFLLLKPWQRGEAAIGGFRSRGLGQVKLEMTTCRFIEINGAASVISLLQDDETQAGLQADEAQQKSWIEAFRKELSEVTNA